MRQYKVVRIHYDNILKTARRPIGSTIMASVVPCASCWVMPARITKAEQRICSAAYTEHAG